MANNPVVYLASPFGFSTSAKRYVLPLVAEAIRSTGATVYEPFSTNKQNGLGPHNNEANKLWAFDIAYADRDAVRKADAIFAVINGMPPDEGVCVELGIAIALGKPTFLFRDDFRKCADSNLLDCNLMMYSGLPKKSWQTFVYRSIDEITDPRKGLVQWVHTQRALADIPEKQMTFMLDRCGLSSALRHGGRGESYLLTHLAEVRFLLKEKLGCQDPALLAAALFHSIYGTEGFQGKTLSLSERHTLQELIGTEGEFLAHLNCVMDRSSLDAAVASMRSANGGTAVVTTSLGSPYTIMTREELGGEKIALTAKQLQGLLTLHFADWAQQVAPYSFWSYRREAYAAIAATLGGVHAALHADIMATEPADAEQRVPEMVRARKLGIFQKVLDGEMTYDDVYDTDAVAGQRQQPVGEVKTGVNRRSKL